MAVLQAVLFRESITEKELQALQSKRNAGVKTQFSAVFA